MVAICSTAVDHNSGHYNDASMLDLASLCTAYNVTWNRLGAVRRI